MKSRTIEPRAPVPIAASVTVSILSILAVACASEADVPEEVAVELTSDDGDWIRLDGTIVSVGPSAFVLDYGD